MIEYIQLFDDSDIDATTTDDSLISCIHWLTAPL